MWEDIVTLPQKNNTVCPFTSFTCGISYCEGGYSIKRSNRDFYTFEYIVEGEGTVRENNVEFNASCGDVYILHPNTRQYYFSHNDNPWTKIWFNISGQIITHMLRNYHILHINHVPKIDVRDLFEKFIDDARSASFTYTEKFDRSLVTLLKIIQVISDKTNTDGNIPRDALILKNYLEKNFSSAITVESLARLICKSVTQTSRIFKAAFNITPYAYLLELRLEAAELMLKNTSMAVNEIAARLNFADEHYFSNFFKEKNGMSPKQFRNSLNNGC